jgi:hypothetical protein
MYITFLLSVTIFLTSIFIILWVRTYKFNFTKLKKTWIYCKNRVNHHFEIKKQIDQAKAKGEKPFYYGNKGSIVIYAIDKRTANFKYQRMLLKARKRNLKKTA